MSGIIFRIKILDKSRVIAEVLLLWLLLCSEEPNSCDTTFSLHPCLHLPFDFFLPNFSSVQFSSVAQSCLTLCDPMDCSMPGLPVHHQLPELTHTQVHSIGDAIQPSNPLSSPSPPTFNLSQHQGLFQWVSSLHQVAIVLEFQLQHQSFQWIFSTDFL